MESECHFWVHFVLFLFSVSGMHFVGADHRVGGRADGFLLHVLYVAGWTLPFLRSWLCFSDDRLLLVFESALGMRFVEGFEAFVGVGGLEGGFFIGFRGCVDSGVFDGGLHVGDGGDGAFDFIGEA